MENKVKIFPAFLSLLLPGLGQVAQKRFGTGAAFFALHLFTSFIPYHLIICAALYWNWNWSYNSHPVTWIFASAFFACLILTAFFAVLDTVLWQLDHQTHFRKSYWALVTIPFLLVILLPAISSAREAARRMQCGNHVKHLVLAMHNYHDNHGHLPPAYTVDADGKPLHSWRVLLLPYLEHSALYKEIRLDEPWDSEYNKQFHSRVPPVLQCPSNRHLSILLPTGERKGFLFDNGDNRCSYSLVIGKETAFDDSKTAMFADIQDDINNTALIVERVTPVNWMQPDNDIPFAKACLGIDKDISGIGSMHPNGCYLGFTDGKALFFPNSISPDVLKSVLTKSGGETITLP